jgi:hypothetical protein
MNQQDPDCQITRLASAMNDAFPFVQGAGPLQAIEAQIGETPRLTIQRVTERGYFITEYAKQKSFCQLSPAPQCSQLTSVPWDSDRKIWYH